MFIIIEIRNVLVVYACCHNYLQVLGSVTIRKAVYREILHAK